jgi:hypothetical protein
MSDQILVVGCILGFVFFVIWLIVFLLDGYSWSGLKMMSHRQTMKFIKDRNRREQQRKNRSNFMK